MSNTVDTTIEVETTSESTNIVEEVMDPETVCAKIIKEDDGFHVVDFDGSIGPVCKLCDEGNKTIVLTKNKSNRQWYNVAKAEKEIAENGYCALYFKGAKKLGPSTSRIPNEALIKYLPEEEQAEYKAIIARAMAAKEADKKKPMTEREKLEAKIAKAKEALAKLEAEAAEG